MKSLYDVIIQQYMIPLNEVRMKSLYDVISQYYRIPQKGVPVWRD